MLIREYHTWNAKREYTGRIVLHGNSVPKTIYSELIIPPPCPAEPSKDPNGWYIVQDLHAGKDACDLLRYKIHGTVRDRRGENSDHWFNYRVIHYLGDITLGNKGVE